VDRLDEHAPGAGSWRHLRRRSRVHRPRNPGFHHRGSLDHLFRTARMTIHY